jgi:transcriptional regulator GlxA family with amidase domain
VIAQIVLFDGCESFDVIAPFEVLVAGSDAVGGELAVELVSAEGPRAVRTGSRGLLLQATATLDPDKPGFVIVPGAAGPIEADRDDGVETIPVLLARVGETEAIPLMARAFANPEIVVATGVNVIAARVVDDGDLVTAGGVTSGLDLALYLLERQYGSRVALAVEALFEYERRGTVWTRGGRTPVAHRRNDAAS